MGPKKQAGGKQPPQQQSTQAPVVAKAQWNEEKVLAKKNLCGVDDMTLLAKVRNEDIVDNIKKRFENGIIYCYIGSVLISINPYQELGLYTQEVLEQYIGKSRLETPPHLFAIAEETYRMMINDRENQCIIISGESGAGKTEASKKILQYIAAVSGSSEGFTNLKDLLLETSPLLEAFGNAKTLRNNNSSRFGKYFEIEFSPQGEPEGGRITNYLLEKSRVVFQTPGERNFHIFYQLCAGASPQEQKEYQLRDASFFNYLKGNLTIDDVDDAEEFRITRNAMDVIGLTKDEQHQVLKLISAILWIGNTTFTENSAGAAQIKDPAPIHIAAQMLGVEPDLLSSTLQVRMMETMKGGRRGTQYHVPLNAVQASAARDAYAKGIYDRIFNWLVDRLNSALQKRKGGDKLVIGVLDIYGFEIFQKNGFEQLCINYVNEKLQQLFIELTLKQEQEEYVREGIKWEPIDFFDNRQVVELIEGAKNAPGVFALLDDACATAHADNDDSDNSFAQRLHDLSRHKHFDSRGKAFCVHHYAGDVVYESTGMTEKNKDVLARDLLEVIQNSKNDFLLSLFPEKIDYESKKRPTTAGFKIKSSASALMTELQRCNPHYVRTIKPNDEKKPKLLDAARVQHQVKYLGLLENIRVRRAGWAYRQVFDKFLYRFYLLSRRTSYAAEYTWQGSAIDGCRAILEDCGISKEQWQLGKTKVFLRHPETLWALEHLREKYWDNMVSKIQRMWRAYVRRKHECATRIQRAYREWTGTRIYYQLRDRSQQLFLNKKERLRFSMISMRRYHGDYLEYKSNTVLQEALASTPISGEQVCFSSRCSVLVFKALGGAKPSPRFLIVTNSALYLLVTKMQNKVAVTALERRIPFSSISELRLSPFADDLVVVAVNEEPDVVLDVPFKTEFVTYVNWNSSNIPLSFPESLPFKKTKNPNKLKTFVFKKDETIKEVQIKKNVVMVFSGMPSSSVPAKPIRPRAPPKSSTRRAGPASSAPPPLPSVGRSAAALPPPPPPGAAGRGAPPPPPPPGAGRAATPPPPPPPGATASGRGAFPPPPPAGSSQSSGAGKSPPAGRAAFPPPPPSAPSGSGRGTSAASTPPPPPAAGRASAGRGASAAASPPPPPPPTAAPPPPPTTAATSTPPPPAAGRSAAGRAAPSAAATPAPSTASAGRGRAAGAPASDSSTSTAPPKQPQPVAATTPPAGRGAATSASGARAAPGATNANSPAKQPSTEAAPAARKAAPPPPTKKQPRVKAVFDYVAQAPDELTFNEGDLINLIGKDDSGWWTGELSGKTGLFPANYVNEI